MGIQDNQVRSKHHASRLLRKVVDLVEGSVAARWGGGQEKRREKEGEKREGRRGGEGRQEEGKNKDKGREFRVFMIVGVCQFLPGQHNCLGIGM